MFDLAVTILDSIHHEIIFAAEEHALAPEDA